MERNDIGVFDPLAQEIGRGARDEGIADAVEPVLAQVVAARNVLVDGVRADVLGDGVVELRIETGNVERRLGQVAHAAVDNDQAGRVVQRGQVVELLQVVVGLVRDQLGPDKVAAVHDAVTHVGDVFFGGDLGHAGVVDQGLEEDVEGIGLRGHFGVFGDFLVVDHLLAAPCVSDFGRWCG